MPAPQHGSAMRAPGMSPPPPSFIVTVNLKVGSNEEVPAYLFFLYFIFFPSLSVLPIFPLPTVSADGSPELSASGGVGVWWSRDTFADLAIFLSARLSVGLQPS